MNLWKSAVIGLIAICTTAAGHADVNVFVQDQNGVAWLRYACTAGEVVRGFAINVQVDRGAILGVTNFLVGPSRVGATGYGIFPSSYRDSVVLLGGTTPDWTSPGYSPVASVIDNPSDTLSGLGSNGVTLEFGALWDPTQPLAAPAQTGILCALLLSQPADVTVSPNNSRGGVTTVNSDVAPLVSYGGSAVGPLITDSRWSGTTIRISFHGGELQTAPTVKGPWTGSGNSSGTYAEDSLGHAAKFFRVQSR